MIWISRGFLTGLENLTYLRSLSHRVQDGNKRIGFPISVRILMYPYEQIFQPRDNYEFKINWDDISNKQTMGIQSQINKGDNFFNIKCNDTADCQFNKGSIIDIKAYDICESQEHLNKIDKKSLFYSKNNANEMDLCQKYFKGVFGQTRKIYSCSLDDDADTMDSSAPEQTLTGITDPAKMENEHIIAMCDICELIPQGEIQAADLNVNLKLPHEIKISKDIVDECVGPVGPGADKTAEYKNTEYFCYHPMSYYNAEVALAKYRLPQPSSKMSKTFAI